MRASASRRTVEMESEERSMVEERAEGSQEGQEQSAPPSGLRRPGVRLLALVALGIGLMALFRLTPLRELLNEDHFAAFVHAMGPWARPTFVLVFGVALGLWVPGTFASIAGVALFGKWEALGLNYAGANLGAWIGFGIARGVGGDALQQVLGGRVKLWDRYRALIERRGFESVLYLRLIPTPYTAVSYLAGLSPIPFRKYALATAIGILPGSVAMTLVLGTVVEGFRAGDIRAVFSWETALAISLFLPVLLLPRGVEAARRRWGWFGGIQLDPEPAHAGPSDDGAG
jgi:uncharacterized membrane protein YdjX (TVP38/TMEM64 family)